jgi:hypothetical protein
MGPSSRGATLLFWLMFLAGGAALVACLVLPPWLEVRALRKAHALAQQRIAELEADLTRVSKQIEHLQSDPAYLERLARKEFGIETPGIEWVEPPTRPMTQPAPTPAGTPPERGQELATALEHATHSSPFVAVFVLDETRPIVMVMAGVVMLMALVLLLRGGTSK